MPSTCTGMFVTVEKTMGKSQNLAKKAITPMFGTFLISDIQIDLRYIHFYTGTTLLKSTKLIFKLINL